MINIKNFSLIISNAQLIEELCDLLGGDMPNIEMPTGGGKVWWNNLVEYNGWRLQQNKITKHCRILDPNDCRKAWGSENVMRNALNSVSKIKSSQEMKFNNTPNSNTNTAELLKTLENLGELKNKGIISEDEFVKKKDEILSRI